MEAEMEQHTITVGELAAVLAKLPLDAQVFMSTKLADFWVAPINAVGVRGGVVFLQEVREENLRDVVYALPE